MCWNFQEEEQLCDCDFAITISTVQDAFFSIWLFLSYSKNSRILWKPNVNYHVHSKLEISMIKEKIETLPIPSILQFNFYYLHTF